MNCHQNDYLTYSYAQFLFVSDKLKQSAPSRIVNVSSIGHKWAPGIDFDNMKSEKKYNVAFIYYNSKLCNLLFTRELARRLEGTGNN